MLFFGDEAYKPSEEEPKAKEGGRHRVVVEMENGKPARMAWEINYRAQTPSKL